MNEPGIDLTGARILIVDDVPANLDLLSQTLENDGYNVLVATSGETALKVAEQTEPDLIMLDVMMPGLDGFETCKRFKANPKTRDIPVIFLTAKAQTEDTVKGFDLGAVDYVTKPFDVAELRVRARTHLCIHILQAALRHSLDENAQMKEEHETFLRRELGNRLERILGYSDMVMQFESEALSEGLQEWVTAIHKGATNMSVLMTEMKQIQDFESGRFELRKARMEVEPLVKQVISDQETIYGALVSFQMQSSLAGDAVLADANLMAGVFRNVIQNAVEHTVELPNEAERTIRITLSSESGRSVVSVQNGGEPIPAEKLGSFFEKFNTSKDEKGGTGLGTTYAYLVTKEHGGEISVTSSREDGTTVRVALPLA